MGDVIDLKARLGAEVVPLFEGRAHFGLRPPTREAVELAGEADRRLKALNRIERAAQAALEQMDGSAARRRAAHPDMHRDFAALLEGLARQARQLAEDARTLGHSTQRATLVDVAGILEDLSAEIALFLETHK